MSARAATVYVERYEVRDASTGEIADHCHDFNAADQDFTDKVDAIRDAGGDPSNVTLVAVLATGG